MKPDLNPYKKTRKEETFRHMGALKNLFLDFVLINLEGKVLNASSEAAHVANF